MRFRAITLLLLLLSQPGLSLAAAWDALLVAAPEVAEAAHCDGAIASEPQAAAEHASDEHDCTSCCDLCAASTMVPVSVSPGLFIAPNTDYAASQTRAPPPGSDAVPYRPPIYS